jgi:threonyl-tRNA synthetase
MADDRKTPEMRAQMTDIERLRHSAAHVLATAIICHPEVAAATEGSLNPVTNHTSNE